MATILVSTMLDFAKFQNYFSNYFYEFVLINCRHLNLIMSKFEIIIRLSQEIKWRNTFQLNILSIHKKSLNYLQSVIKLT